MLTTCREAFYGGAAGGGKSSALLMAALQYADVPGYRALIIRKTYADLVKPGSLMDRAHQWLGNSDAKWRDKEKTWVFPSGATLSFGHMEGPSDHYAYLGAEYQFIGFDELTQIPEFQYRYLISRCRRTQAFIETCQKMGLTVPLRIRGASNPGNIGHEWVFRRFIVEGKAKGRAFVPATLDENPHLDRDAYEQGLMELDPVTRAQLLKGDWDVRDAGGKFQREWLDGKFLRSDEVPRLEKVVRFFDLAATAPSNENPDPDYTATVKLGVDKHKNYYVIHVDRKRGSPGEVEKFIVASCEDDEYGVDVGVEEEPGSASKHYVHHLKRDVLDDRRVVGVRSGKSKEARANPIAGAMFDGKVYIVRAPWNSMFLDELELFPAKGAHDDMVDALSGAQQMLKRKVQFHFGDSLETTVDENGTYVPSANETDGGELPLNRRFIPASGDHRLAYGG